MQLRADIRYVRLEILKAIQGLASRKQPATVTSLANEVRCHRNTIDNHMSFLIGDGLVIMKVGSGSRPNTYSLTAAGKEVVTPNVPTAV